MTTQAWVVSPLEAPVFHHKPNKTRFPTFRALKENIRRRFWARVFHLKAIAKSVDAGEWKFNSLKGRALGIARNRGGQLCLLCLLGTESMPFIYSTVLPKWFAKVCGGFPEAEQEGFEITGMDTGAISALRYIASGSGIAGFFMKRHTDCDSKEVDVFFARTGKYGKVTKAQVLDMKDRAALVALSAHTENGRKFLVTVMHEDGAFSSQIEVYGIKKDGEIRIKKGKDNIIEITFELEGNESAVCRFTLSGHPLGNFQEAASTENVWRGWE